MEYWPLIKGTQMSIWTRKRGGDMILNNQSHSPIIKCLGIPILVFWPTLHRWHCARSLETILIPANDFLCPIVLMNPAYTSNSRTYLRQSRSFEHRSCYRWSSRSTRLERCKSCCCSWLHEAVHWFIYRCTHQPCSRRQSGQVFAGRIIQASTEIWWHLLPHHLHLLEDRRYFHNGGFRYVKMPLHTSHILRNF